MADTRIIVLEAGIQVVNLDIPHKDVADFLRGLPEEEREPMFIRALEVGIFCLERARTSQDTEFVRRQVDSLLGKVEKAVETIPDQTQKALLEKIGTSEGQVLAPIHTLVNEVSKTTTDRLKEVRDLLFQEIDPAKETTTLGKVLRDLRNLLDPGRTDSVQGSVNASIKSVTTEDGALAKAVRAVVGDSVKPLSDEVDRLAKEIRGQEAAAEALEQTTQKGASYEDQVVLELQEWSQVAGAEVHHVGSDNQPGDVLVKVATSSLASTPVTIVLEVRDRQSPLGRKAITSTCEEAMAVREANSGIYLSRSRDGLANEIGEWAEGETERGPFIACTHDHLITALRFLMVQKRLASLRAAAPEVDSASIEAQIQRIRTTLDRVKSINRKVTEVRAGASDIQTEAEALRDEVRGALTTIEDAIRVAPSKVEGNDSE
jgi:hypothetical protein